MIAETGDRQETAAVRAGRGELGPGSPKRAEVAEAELDPVIVDKAVDAARRSG